MAHLLASFSKLSVSQRGLASRANGIAAARPVQVKAAAPALVAARVDTTVVAKLKTRKAAAKRFKITGSGKVMCRPAGKQHLNEKMSRKRICRLSNEKAVFAGDVNINVRKAMPYAKISLKKQREANKDHD